MRKNTNDPRILRFAKKFLLCTFVIFVVGSVFLNSYETTLNAKTKDVQEQIATVQSDIDGLQMKKQDLVSFTRLKSVAAKKGYDYEETSVAATVVGVDND